ncbi:hypothetical protein Tco_1122706 [Tanacetum coccineum]|uniref:Uncharacterized protein n=1 Tax=Tanacetum coccineum TaxID=301880 RepID=A0ABQ5J2D6_9ASTR
MRLKGIAKVAIAVYKVELRKVNREELRETRYFPVGLKFLDELLKDIASKQNAKACTGVRSGDGHVYE